MGLSLHTLCLHHPAPPPRPRSKGNEHSLLSKLKGQWELITANKLDTKAASATPGYLWCSQWDSGLLGATSLTSKWPFHSNGEGDRTTWRYRKEVLLEPTASAFYGCPVDMTDHHPWEKLPNSKASSSSPTSSGKRFQAPARKLKPRAEARGPAHPAHPAHPAEAAHAPRGPAGVGAARTERRQSAHPTSCSMALRSGVSRGHAVGGGPPAGAGPRRSAAGVPRPRCSRASAPVAGRPASAAVCGSRRCHGDELCSAWTGSLLWLPALSPGAADSAAHGELGPGERQSGAPGHRVPAATCPQFPVSFLSGLNQGDF